MHTESVQTLSDGVVVKCPDCGYFLIEDHDKNMGKTVYKCPRCGYSESPKLSSKTIPSFLKKLIKTT